MKRKSTTSKKKPPKYLSLRLQLSLSSPPQPPPQPTPTPHKCSTSKEIIAVEEDNDDDDGDIVDDHVGLLFHSAESSLDGLLDPAATTSEEALPYKKGSDDQNEERWLVGSAMRCKERDWREERWVSYSQVVAEEKKEQEEVSSCSTHDDDDDWCWSWLNSKDDDSRRRLVLKLNCEEILDVWCNKGPIYVQSDPQPQYHLELDDHDDEYCNLWRLRKREASMLRYKQKRQSRLFSKRIRYQVRKLNAEKRPRLKGRFVKRINSSSQAQRTTTAPSMGQ